MSKRDPSPTREQIALLEPFARLELDQIVVVSTPAEIDQSMRELRACRVVGFDTESKPTFIKGEISDGPHLVQFATPEKAYLFQLHRLEFHAAVAALMESKTITKVGFGLSSDRRQIAQKLRVQPQAILDLNSIFKQYGYRKSVGVKGAVAVVLQRRFLKSKKASTSNWANRRLTDLQLLYAANDAYAAIQVFNRIDSAPANFMEDQGRFFPPPTGLEAEALSRNLVRDAQK